MWKEKKSSVGKVWSSCRLHLFVYNNVNYNYCELVFAEKIA